MFTFSNTSNINEKNISYVMALFKAEIPNVHLNLMTYLPQNVISGNPVLNKTFVRSYELYKSHAANLESKAHIY